MILYTFRRCPYAIRARLTLLHGNCSFEHREILLRDKPQSMLKLSPKGTVPVFYVDGQVIDESLDIILWALDKLEGCQDLRLEGDERKEALELIRSNDNQFKAALDRYKYADRLKLTLEEHNDAWKECQLFIQSIQKRLEQTKYLFADNLSFVDYAIFPFLRQCRRVDEERFESLEIAETLAWMKNLSGSKLFKKAMEKHPLFKE